MEILAGSGSKAMGAVTISEAQSHDEIVRRRFGRYDAKPCKRPETLTCTMWECQYANRTIIQLNFDHFTRLLTTNLDSTTRQTVEQLLAEAKADLHGRTPPLGRYDRSADEFTVYGLPSD